MIRFIVLVEGPTSKSNYHRRRDSSSTLVSLQIMQKFDKLHLRAHFPNHGSIHKQICSTHIFRWEMWEEKGQSSWWSETILVKHIAATFSGTLQYSRTVLNYHCNAPMPKESLSNPCFSILVGTPHKKTTDSRYIYTGKQPHNSAEGSTLPETK